MSEAYPLLAGYISYIHVKDARMDNGSVVPAGEGDRQLRLFLQQLKQTGYSGFMSLDPHLQATEKLAGLSQPELFVVAANAIKKLLAEQEMKWNLTDAKSCIYWGDFFSL